VWKDNRRPRQASERQTGRSDPCALPGRTTRTAGTGMSSIDEALGLEKVRKTAGRARVGVAPARMASFELVRQGKKKQAGGARRSEGVARDKTTTPRTSISTHRGTHASIYSMYCRSCGRGRFAQGTPCPCSAPSNVTDKRYCCGPLQLQPFHWDCCHQLMSHMLQSAAILILVSSSSMARQLRGSLACFELHSPADNPAGVSANLDGSSRLPRRQRQHHAAALEAYSTPKEGWETVV
jgi:hypothetical protein